MSSAPPATTLGRAPAQDARLQAALCSRAAIPPRRAVRGLPVGGFLAFLLFDMSWKGLSGFTQYQAAVPIDFPRSDLILDPAALKGPDASDVVAGADLEGALVQAATAAYGADAAEMFGAGAARTLGRQLIADPGLLDPSLDLLASGRQPDRCRGQAGQRRDEREDRRPAPAKARPAPRPQPRFPDRIGCDRPVGGRRLGSAQGHAS